jgi:organic hydroperoxide reductase OsmC/OhrA
VSSKTHSYGVSVTWTGNRGSGTSGYRDYDRSHEVSASGAPGPAGPAPAEPAGPGTAGASPATDAGPRTAGPSPATDAGPRTAGPSPATDGGPRPIEGSSDPAFRGDRARWNPEQLLTAALAQCHMLWYLHLCAATGVVVTGYADEAVGTMREDPDGGGRFTEVVLRPRVTVQSADMIERAASLHREAHEKCFIASSVAFPVRHKPVISIAT